MCVLSGDAAGDELDMFRVAPEGRTGSVGGRCSKAASLLTVSLPCVEGGSGAVATLDQGCWVGGACPELQDLTGVPWTPSVERGIREER